MRAAWTIAILLALFGCSSNAPAPPEPPPSTQASGEPEPKETPPEQNPLFEQLHSGFFQADAAAKKLAEAVEVAKRIKDKATGNLATYMQDMVPIIDDAGGALEDAAGGDPPTLEEVKADPGKYQTLRDSLINKVNDLIKDMREQEDAAADMSENGDPPLRADAAKLDQLLNEIIDDLRGALKALGGKEEAPS